MEECAKSHINRFHYNQRAASQPSELARDANGFCCPRCYCCHKSVPFNCSWTSVCCGKFPNTKTIPNQVSCAHVWWLPQARASRPGARPRVDVLSRHTNTATSDSCWARARVVSHNPHRHPSSSPRPFSGRTTRSGTTWPRKPEASSPASLASEATVTKMGVRKLQASATPPLPDPGRASGTGVHADAGKLRGHAAGRLGQTSIYPVSS